MVKIEEEIHREGPRFYECLLKNNPILSPSQLDEYFEAYTDFYPDRTGLIWSRDSHGNHIQTYYSKILLLVSGPPAGGKHELIKHLPNYLPDQLFPLVTATTRAPRTEDGEVEGIDHYFYSLEQFLREKDNGEFIETIEQSPGRWYGTPKRSIIDALAQPKPIITSDVEMGSGWPAVEKFVATISTSQRPEIIEVYVSPEMRAHVYFDQWLPKHRPDKEDDRDIIAAWTIAHGADRARFIVGNRIEKGLGEVTRQARLLSTRLQVKS